MNKDTTEAIHFLEAARRHLEAAADLIGVAAMARPDEMATHLELETRVLAGQVERKGSLSINDLVVFLGGSDAN